MRDPDPAAAAARVRAARAYAKMSREALAGKLGYSPSTIDLMEGKRAVGRRISWEEMSKVADATGLPFEFFTADLARLREIVPEGELAVVTKRAKTSRQQRHLTLLQQGPDRPTPEQSNTQPPSTGDRGAQGEAP